MLTVFVFLSFAFIVQCITGSVDMGKTISEQHQPKWLISTTDLSKFDLYNASNDMNILPYETIKKYPGSLDHEHIIAIRKYFWNCFHGIAMEMGAVDGKKHSATSIFEHYFGKFMHHF